METDNCQIQQRPCVLPILPQTANLPYFTTFTAFRYNSVLKLSPLSFLRLSVVLPFEDESKGMQFWGRASLINGETAVVFRNSGSLEEIHTKYVTSHILGSRSSAVGTTTGLRTGWTRIPIPSCKSQLPYS